MCVCFVLCLSLASTVSALAADVAGTVRDETGGALPGVSVELRSGSAAPRLAVTDARGAYAFDSVPPGPAHVVFTLINFAASRRDAVVPAGGNVRVDVVLHLALNADVIVTGKSTFTNLADADRPAENLVGIAQSASQGAITAQQLDARPMSRAGEVLEWERSRGNASTRMTVYGIGYDLDLFSNFTYFLDDPIDGDQFEQADHRFIAGAKLSHRRLARWGGHSVQNTFGVQLRNDDITNVGLYHTHARVRLDTRRQDTVMETSGGVYGQNEVQWTPWMRTLAGVRADGYRFRVDAGDPENGGATTAGLVRPKGGLVVGPFHGTELYANGGFGFHSNDARGTTVTRDPSTGGRMSPVTPLVRARGAEVGIRTVAIPHLQSSLSLWSLSLASELVFSGDAGTTEVGRPSHRYGAEWANYYHPVSWLGFDGDVSLSRSRFTADDPAGDHIPGSLESVVSLGATVDGLHGLFGSARLRSFGPRPLIESGSVRSKATGLVNVEAGCKIGKGVRVALDVFNLLDAQASDIDYYYGSRLSGEPLGGIDDIHFHPAAPRTARVSLIVGR